MIRGTNQPKSGCPSQPTCGSSWDTPLCIPSIHSCRHQEITRNPENPKWTEDAETRAQKQWAELHTGEESKILTWKIIQAGLKKVIKKSFFFNWPAAAFEEHPKNNRVVGHEQSHGPRLAISPLPYLRDGGSPPSYVASTKVQPKGWYWDAHAGAATGPKCSRQSCHVNDFVRSVGQHCSSNWLLRSDNQCDGVEGVQRCADGAQHKVQGDGLHSVQRQWMQPKCIHQWKTPSKTTLHSQGKSLGFRQKSMQQKLPWLTRRPMAFWGALGGVWPAGRGRFSFPSTLP